MPFFIAINAAACAGGIWGSVRYAFGATRVMISVIGAVRSSPALNTLPTQPIDGSAASNLTNFDDGQSIYSFAYSADGKKLAVARGLKTTDVVLAKNLR